MIQAYPEENGPKNDVFDPPEQFSKSEKSQKLPKQGNNSPKKVKIGFLPVAQSQNPKISLFLASTGSLGGFDGLFNIARCS